MMGRTHALTGAIAGLALCQPVPELTALHTLTVAAVTAGAALWPDMDHPQSTAANAVGPVTRIPAALISVISGGHRNGTHSLIGIAAAGVVTIGAALIGGFVLGLWVAFLVAIGTGSLLGRSRPAMAGHVLVFLLIGGLATTTAVFDPPRTGIIVAAVMLGFAVHIAGDVITEEGCPLLWPAKPRVGLGLITTDGLIERWLITPVAVAAVTVWGSAQTHTTLLLECGAALSAAADMITEWSAQ